MAMIEARIWKDSDSVDIHIKEEDYNKLLFFCDRNGLSLYRLKGE